MTYQVTAPYVTLRVPNAVGQQVLLGFHRDALVPAGVNLDDLERHLRKGMVVEIDAPAPAEPAEPATAEPEGADVKRPHGNASQAAWVDYAVARRPDGVSEEDARAAAQAKTKAELIAEFGS